MADVWWWSREISKKFFAFFAHVHSFPLKSATYKLHILFVLKKFSLSIFVLHCFFFFINELLQLIMNLQNDREILLMFHILTKITDVMMCSNWILLNSPCRNKKFQIFIYLTGPAYILRTLKGCRQLIE